MKVPKRTRTYCRRCGKHTVHEVSLYKKGRENPLVAGARRHKRRKGGYGGQHWPQQRDKAKTTQKRTLSLKCTVCGRTAMRSGIRLKKLEIVR